MTGIQELKIVGALCAEKPLLSEIRNLFPRAWEQVHEELEVLAKNPEPNQIAKALTQSYQKWRELQREQHTLSTRFDRNLAQSLALALIRKLSLEQFCCALTQATIADRRSFQFVDRFMIERVILRMAQLHRPLPLKWHQRVWRLVGNRASAAFRLHEHGIYSLYPLEFILGLCQRIGSLQTLEIGAGRGMLTQYLRSFGANIVGVDDYSWEDKIPMGQTVIRMDGTEAVTHYKPQAVISCWPPPGNPFEKAVLSSSWVQVYIAIVSRYGYASGDFNAYASARDFVCTQVHQLARLLYPPEINSTVFIFTRKTP